MSRRALAVVAGVVLVTGAGRLATTAAPVPIAEAGDPDPRSGRGRALRAEVLNAQGRHDHAAAAALEAAELDPGGAAGWREAGRAFLALGDLDRAAACLAVAILRDRHDAAARGHLVRVLERQGRHEQARAVAER